MGHTLLRRAWKSHLIKKMEYLDLNTVSNLGRIEQLNKGHKWLFKILDYCIQINLHVDQNMFVSLIDHNQHLKAVWFILAPRLSSSNALEKENLLSRSLSRGENISEACKKVFHHAQYAEIISKTIQITDHNKIHLDTIIQFPYQAELVAKILRLFCFTRSEVDAEFCSLAQVARFGEIDINILKSVILKYLLLQRQSNVFYHFDRRIIMRKSKKEHCFELMQESMVAFGGLVLFTLVTLLELPVCLVKLMFHLAKGTAVIFLDDEYRFHVTDSLSIFFKELDISNDPLFSQLNKKEKKALSKGFLGGLIFPNFENNDFNNILQDYESQYKKAQRDAASKNIHSFFNNISSSLENEISKEIFEYAGFK